LLYQTLLQPKLLLIFFIFGVFCGIFFDCLKLINYPLSKVFHPKKDNYKTNKSHPRKLFSKINYLLFCKIPSKIITFAGLLLLFLLAFLINLKYNYGEIRLFPVIIIFFAIFTYKTFKKLLHIKF